MPCIGDDEILRVSQAKSRPQQLCARSRNHFVVFGRQQQYRRRDRRRVAPRLILVPQQPTHGKPRKPLLRDAQNAVVRRHQHQSRNRPRRRCPGCGRSASPADAPPARCPTAPRHRQTVPPPTDCPRCRRTPGSASGTVPARETLRGNPAGSATRPPRSRQNKPPRPARPLAASKPVHRLAGGAVPRSHPRAPAGNTARTAAQKRERRRSRRSPPQSTPPIETAG